MSAWSAGAARAGAWAAAQRDGAGHGKAGPGPRQDLRLGHLLRHDGEGRFRQPYM